MGWVVPTDTQRTEPRTVLFIFFLKKNELQNKFATDNAQRTERQTQNLYFGPENQRRSSFNTMWVNPNDTRVNF